MDRDDFAKYYTAIVPLFHSAGVYSRSAKYWLIWWRILGGEDDSDGYEDQDEDDEDYDRIMTEFEFT